MKHLDKILKEVNFPNMLIKTKSFDGLNDLKNKIKLLNVLSTDIKTEDEFISLLSESQVQTYRNLTRKGETTKDLFLPNMYDIVEEFGSIQKLRVSAAFMREFKQKGFHISCNYNKYTNCKCEIPPFKIDDDIPLLSYSVFDKKQYQKLKDGTLTMCVNLPFEYYSKIHTWDNFFCYDVLNNEYWATGANERRLKELLADIAIKGIQNPLLMKIQHATVVSTKDCYGRLLSAMLLKIPTIPVALFITGERVDELETLVPLTGDKNILNKICNPELMFL